MEPTATFLLLLISGAAALLLWGTRMVRTGVTRGYGPQMRRILSSGLSNSLTAALSGTATAAVLQSSTAVALFAAALVRSGALQVSVGLAIMLGADIGSALVASLLTLDVRRFWPLFIFVGYVLHTVYDGRSSKGKQSGRILLGIGLILLALDSMAEVSADLSQSPVVHLVLGSLGQEPIIAVLVAALLTWLAHSSIAMLLFVASLAAAGILDEPALIVAMVLGVNLGGAMPAIMLTLAEPAAARRIAIGNGLFKLAGTVIGLLILPLLVELYGLLPGNAPFRTVLLHILFNLALAVAFIWFVRPMAGLLERLVKEPPGSEEEFGPRYLSSGPGDEMPSLALSSLTRETLRMLDMVDAMLGRTFDVLRSGDREACAEVHKLDDRVDTLYEAIKSYATDLTRQDLEINESRRAVDILSYATGLENAGDIVDKSLVDLAEKKIKAEASFSDAGHAELERLHGYVVETMRLAASVLMHWNEDDAQLLLKRKRDFKGEVAMSSELHLARLRAGEARSVETSSLHLDILGDIQRINSLVAGIAYAVARPDPSAERSSST